MNSVFLPIRPVSDDDIAAIEASAKRFADRHGIDTSESDTAREAVEWQAEKEKDCYGYRRLSDLWSGCLARAVNESPHAGIGVAYGNIGIWRNE